MSDKVSNFRGFIHRKYNINGTIIDETEREMAQLYNDDGDKVVDRKNLYLGQVANFLPNNFTDLIDMPTHLGSNQYVAYGPGLIYLPKQYYTLDDFLPKEWYGMHNGESFSNLYELFTIMMKEAQSITGIGTIPFLYSYTNPMVLFVDDEDKNLRCFWTFYVEGTYRKNHPQDAPGYQTIKWGLFLQPITYATPISQMEFVNPRDGHGACWWCNTPDGYLNVEFNSKYGFGKAWWFGFYSSLADGKYVADFTEVFNDFENCYKCLTECHYYPCAQSYTGADYVQNFNGMKTSLDISTGSTILGQGMYLLVDVSKCSLFPSNGFFILSRGSWGVNIYRLQWGNGPGNNNPDNRDDDPNDDDNKPDPDDKGGDGDHDNTDDPIPKPGIPQLSGAQAGLFTIFSPNTSQLKELGKVLWSPDAWQAIKQYFTTPLDSVLGLAIVPVDPAKAAAKEIMLGSYKTGVTAPVVTSDYVTIDCGSIPITRYYGSYLDYSPYTHIKCYLPYIGEVDVSPDEAMQKNINVQYFINVVTGDVAAMLFLDGDLFYTATGNCIRQLPLSSRDYSGIIATAVNATSSIITAAATAGIGNAAIKSAKSAPRATEESIELASAKAASNNVASSTSLLGDVMAAKMRYHHAGSMGTGAGQLCRQKPYLIIERPNLDLANNYKSFVGYPCNKTKQLGLCRGFTQVEATNIAVRDATDVELSMIKELLMEGVIF